MRDAIYLDGGLLWWQTAFADGSTPVVSSDGNAAGDMYRLNLSSSFDTASTNLSGLLEPMPKAGGAGNNIAPNYVDGTMMFNYDELYLYGGLPRLTDSASAQSADTILGYEAYQYGSQQDSWSPGFYQGSLTEGVSRYITNGAGVSAPSENLGFYFSGMRSPDWGQIFYEDSSANVTANALITVDMSTMRSEKWSNTTLPAEITPRANAELVWLPVSERGVLLAIGGVTTPEEIFAIGLNDTQAEESRQESPSFMTSIPIYDVGSQQWYLQNTTGDEHPPQLTEFCSVVAVDNTSSFNVYIYGGYDGLNAADEPSDDVWVLSVPAFTWSKVYSGTTSHGRSGHQCIAPYPDKMFVIGGVHQNQANCVEGGFIQVFNLNTLEFENTYDPGTWEQYKSPPALASARKAKRQTIWSDPALAEIFSTTYPKENSIQHFYPYKSDSAASDSTGGKHKTNNTVIIAVGVAAGVVALILIIVMILFFRRKQILKSSTSESSATKRSRIDRWIIGASASRIGKHHDNDSVSTIAPEVQQITPYTSGSTTPPTPSFRVSSPPHHRLPKQPGHHIQLGPSELSSASEKPAAPFELATPYNNLSHPRTSGVVDYAYTAKKGHSPGHSNSSSGSSNYDQDPVEVESPINPSAKLHYAPLTPHSDYQRPLESPTSGTQSVSSSSTLAWPFPSSRGTYDKRKSDEYQKLDPSPPPPQQAPSPYPPMPPMPAQYRSISTGEPDRLRPYMPPDSPPSNSNSYTSNTSSSDQKISSMSSEGMDVESLPSPESSLPQDEKYRQSLMSAVSPVSPMEQTVQPVWAGDSRRRSNSSKGEGREGWWRQQGQGDVGR